MKYRPEIDGIRALAIVPVLGFHIGLIPGGFLGVDVFFVISGYLIFKILLSEIESGTFSFLRFYERRLRRIMPALFVVMFVTLSLAWLFVLPAEFSELAKSLIAALAFVSNVFFWMNSDYFDTSTDLKPFVHTWSLAAEEQFYLLAPIALLAARRFFWSSKLFAIAIATTISFFLAYRYSALDPKATFYLLPFRAWEILLGCIAAVLTVQRDAWFEQLRLRHSAVFEVTGLCLIVAGYVLLDKTMIHPGPLTLVPVAGTFLLICFASEQSVTGRGLSTKFPVGIGLISYSLYLWHQPILALQKHWEIGDASIGPKAAALMTVLILSYFTWRYVERPVRRKDVIGTSAFYCSSIVAIAIVFAVCLYAISQNGFRQRMPPNIVWQSLGEKLRLKGEFCTLKNQQPTSGIRSCEFGDLDSQKSVYLYGDSHAEAMIEELHKAFVRIKVKGIRLAIDGCEIVPTIHDTTDKANLTKDCRPDFEKMLRVIAGSDSDIIVVSRWTTKLYPLAGWIDSSSSTNSEGGFEKDFPDRKYAVLNKDLLLYDFAAKDGALSDFVSHLLSSTNGRVFFVYPVPEISWNIAQLNMRQYLWLRKTLPSISIPYEDFVQRNRFVHRVLEKFESDLRFVSVRPEHVFCNSFMTSRCVAQFDSVPYYYDDDHLSDVGARMLIEREIVTRLVRR